MSLKLMSKKSYVGLDIGHHMIKAVQLERTPVGWRLTRIGSIRVPENEIKDGIIMDPHGLGASIKELLRNTGITATSAFIAVAGGSVVVRTVRIPKMAEQALRKSIKFEAGRYVPNSVEDSYIEFEIIGTTEDNQMDVLIAAAPKEMVDKRVEACKFAGLDVEAVDVEAFAAYRSLVESNEAGLWGDSTIALVDIGSAMTTVSVISNGVFAMTRSIPQGGSTLTEALKSYFKLEENEAEQGKSQLDVSQLLKDDGPVENPPLRVLHPHIDDLVREIRRSLNYYQSQQTDTNKKAPVTAVILCGGTAKLKGLADYVGGKLGLEVAAVGVLDNARFSTQGADMDEKGLGLSVATGLAMRAFSKAA